MLVSLAGTYRVERKNQDLTNYIVFWILRKLRKIFWGFICKLLLKLQLYHCNDHIFIWNLYFRSSHHLHVSLLSRVKMNSTNWPTPNAWVFIAQMVEHCSANAEAMGSNPIEVPKNFFRVNLQLLKLQLPLRWSYLHLKLVFQQFTSSSCYIVLLSVKSMTWSVFQVLNILWATQYQTLRTLVSRAKFIAKLQNILPMFSISLNNKIAYCVKAFLSGGVFFSCSIFCCMPKKELYVMCDVCDLQNNLPHHDDLTETYYKQPF